MKAADFLKAGLGHMDDRAQTYDAPEGERSMGKCVRMFKELTGIEMNETQGWLFMCCLKMVRSQQGKFRADNFEDLAAYAGLAGESANETELAAMITPEALGARRPAEEWPEAVDINGHIQP